MNPTVYDYYASDPKARPNGVLTNRGNLVPYAEVLHRLSQENLRRIAEQGDPNKPALLRPS